MEELLDMPGEGMWECISLVLEIKGIQCPAFSQGVWPEEGMTTGQLLNQLAQKTRMKIHRFQPSLAELAECTEPLLACMKDGSYTVLGKSNTKVMLLYEPRFRKTVTCTAEEFLLRWDGTCYRFKKRFSLQEAGKTFNLAWFLPVVLRYKKYFLDIIVASFFLQLLGLVTPLFTQVILDKVILHKGTATLDVLAVALGAAAIFQTLMATARKYIETHTTNKIDMILGKKLVTHLLSLPLRYFEVRRVGDTMTRVAALNSIRDFLTNSSLTAFLDLFFTVVFLGVMFSYSVFLTCIALLPLPLYLLQNILATPVYKKRLEDVWQSGARSNAFLVESVTGMQTLKALAVEPQFRHRWECLLADYVRCTFSNAKFGILLQASNGTIQHIMTFGILLAGGHAVMQGTFTIGQLIAFQMLAQQLGGPMQRLTGLWQSCQQTFLAVECLGDILNAKPEIVQLHAQHLQEITGEIEFQQVSFRYNAEYAPVLQRVSFRIPAGTRVGIVGRSGSGKSTITKLLERLYLPESGHILLDGEDLLSIRPDWLRQRVGVVLQESQLFQGSIRDNIAFAKPGASMEEVIDAAKQAGAHTFILELADGYDSIVGERGESLSGGQRQRIAIARALLTKPKILIFDEATSALDYTSEHIIMEHIDAIAGNRTFLMIAHRLSTVRHCDQILVIDQGQVAECGTHEELLAQKGLYASLYRQQEGAKAC